MLISRYILIAILPVFAACSTFDSFFGYEQPADEQEAAQVQPQFEPEEPVVPTVDQELNAQEPAGYESELAAVEPVVPEPAYEPPEPVAPQDQLWVIISFRSGHVDVDRKTRKTLNDLAAKFLQQSRSQTLDIRGYADAEPIGGFPGKRHKSAHSYRSQVALSAARAKSVARVFIDAGIDPNIIQSEGFGATNFIAENDTRAGRAKNRRVEIHLITE